MYFGAAVIFVTQSHARINDFANPTPISAADSAKTPEAEDSPGHFKLSVNGCAYNLSDADRRLITHSIKTDLQRRFGDVRILTSSDLAKSDQLGTIEVEIDVWKNRPYWGPAHLGTSKTKLPCYIALHMVVTSSTGATWDGPHRLNATRNIPGGDSRLPFSRARILQGREMVRSMFDRLPALRHLHPTPGLQVAAE